MEFRHPLLSQNPSNSAVVNQTNRNPQHTSPSPNARPFSTPNHNQQAFFNKVIQNQYADNILQNRNDIIQNYLSLIAESKARSSNNHSPSPRSINRVDLSAPSSNSLNRPQSTTLTSTPKPQQFPASGVTSTLSASTPSDNQNNNNNNNNNNTDGFNFNVFSQTEPSNGTKDYASILRSLNSMQTKQEQLQSTSPVPQQQLQQQQPQVQAAPVPVQIPISMQPQQQLPQVPLQVIPTDDMFIHSIEQQILAIHRQLENLQQRITQINKSQLDMLRMNPSQQSPEQYIAFFDQQLNQIWEAKSTYMTQANELQSLKKSFFNFKSTFPNASHTQFLSLPKETKLLLLNATIPTSFTPTIASNNVKNNNHPNLTQQPRVYATASIRPVGTVKEENIPLIVSSFAQLDDERTTAAAAIQTTQQKQPISTVQTNQTGVSQSSSSIKSLIKIEEEPQITINSSVQLNSESPQLPIEVQSIPQSVETALPIKPIDQVDLKKKKKNDAIENDENKSEIEEEEELEDEEQENHNHTHIHNQEEKHQQSELFSISALKPADSKKYERRLEKLEENVIKILDKQEDACSKIKPIALELCKKIAMENEVLKNRPYEAIAAAIIVHGSRLVANPITVKSMAKLTESKEKIINRVFMYLKKNVEGFYNKMPQPEIFIKNICEKLAFATPISETALYLHESSLRLGLVKGQHAATVAACLVKLSACLHNIEMTVKQICEASNVCQISLRLLYRTLYPHRFELIGDYVSLNHDFKATINSSQMLKLD